MRWARLGVGTGFAIAAGLANPNKEILCYYGDGSFGMTAFDMETANRFGVPYLAVIGNNSAMNQIRLRPARQVRRRSAATSATCCRTCRSPQVRRNAGRLWRQEVREPGKIAGALQRGREAVQRTGKSAVINIWVDPREYAPGTKNQTMYRQPVARRQTMNKGTGRCADPGHDACAGRPFGHPADGMARGGRDQGGVAGARRHHAQPAARCAQRRQPCTSPC
ncbi:thiamine pyrophosphate-dependent enzyme [Cupriavidus basilensis]